MDRALNEGSPTQQNSRPWLESFHGPFREKPPFAWRIFRTQAEHADLGGAPLLAEEYPALANDTLTLHEFLYDHRDPTLQALARFHEEAEYLVRKKFLRFETNGPNLAAHLEIPEKKHQSLAIDLADKPFTEVRKKINAAEIAGDVPQVQHQQIVAVQIALFGVVLNQKLREAIREMQMNPLVEAFGHALQAKDLSRAQTILAEIHAFGERIPPSVRPSLPLWEAQLEALAKSAPKQPSRPLTEQLEKALARYAQIIAQRIIDFPWGDRNFPLYPDTEDPTYSLMEEVVVSEHGPNPSETRRLHPPSSARSDFDAMGMPQRRRFAGFVQLFWKSDLGQRSQEAFVKGVTPLIQSPGVLNRMLGRLGIHLDRAHAPQTPRKDSARSA